MIYAAKPSKTKNDKNTVLKNVKIPYEGIKKIIKGFEDRDFLIKNFSQEEQPSTSKDKEESEESEEYEEYEEKKMLVKICNKRTI